MIELILMLLPRMLQDRKVIERTRKSFRICAVLYIYFFYIVTGHAFEDLAKNLFFKSWLNNKNKLNFFFLPKFIKNLLFRRNGLRFKKKIDIITCLTYNYPVYSKTLWIQVQNL